LARRTRRRKNKKNGKEEMVQQAANLYKGMDGEKYGLQKKEVTKFEYFLREEERKENEERMYLLI